MLRPGYVDAIATKFLGQLVASADRVGTTVRIDTDSVLEAIRTEMADPRSLQLGGRMIRPALDRVVLEPLAAAIDRDGRGRTYEVLVEPGAHLATVRSTAS